MNLERLDLENLGRLDPAFLVNPGHYQQRPEHSSLEYLEDPEIPGHLILEFLVYLEDLAFPENPGRFPQHLERWFPGALEFLANLGHLDPGILEHLDPEFLGNLGHYQRHLEQKDLECPGDPEFLGNPGH